MPVELNPSSKNKYANNISKIAQTRLIIQDAHILPKLAMELPKTADIEVNMHDIDNKTNGFELLKSSP